MPLFVVFQDKLAGMLDYFQKEGLSVAEMCLVLDIARQAFVFDEMVKGEEDHGRKN